MGLPLIKPARRTSCIGIDLGRTGVRAAQGTHRQGRWQVTHTGRVEQPKPADGAESARTAAPDLIMRAIRQSSFRGRKVVAGVCPDAVEYHSLTIPEAILNGDAAAINRAVQFEVAHLATVDDEQAEIRHWNLPHAMGQVTGAMGVAAKRDVCRQCHDAICKAGMDCVALDADACALTRTAALLADREPQAVWGVLDLAAGGSRLIVCAHDTPILIRSVGPGGDQWNKALADALRISESAAEVHKKDHGIALSSRGPRGGESAAPASELSGVVFSVLRADLTRLAGQIKRSYEYVLGRIPGGRASDLVMVGCGARMTNLDAHLSRTLGIAARQASSYLGEDGCRLSCTFSRRDSLEEFATAIGLALWQGDAP